eukprot:UN2683
MVKELEGKPCHVQVRGSKDEVDLVRALVAVERGLWVLVVVAHRLHAFSNVQAPLRGGAGLADGDVVLNVLVALSRACDVAARGWLHRNNTLKCVLVVEGELHEDLIHGLLSAVRMLALLVRVDEEHAVLATPPTSHVRHQVARGVPSGGKLLAALDRGVWWLAADCACSHVDVPLRRARA